MKKHIYSFVGLWLLMIFCQAAAWSQQAPSQGLPANVTGKWTLYCNDPNGSTSVLTQIDPGSNRIVGTPTSVQASQPVALAVSGHDLWVADYLGELLHFKLTDH